MSKVGKNKQINSKKMTCEKQKNNRKITCGKIYFTHINNSTTTFSQFSMIIVAAVEKFKALKIV